MEFFKNVAAQITAAVILAVLALVWQVCLKHYKRHKKSIDLSVSAGINIGIFVFLDITTILGTLIAAVQTHLPGWSLPAWFGILFHLAMRLYAIHSLLLEARVMGNIEWFQQVKEARGDISRRVELLIERETELPKKPFFLYGVVSTAIWFWLGLYIALVAQLNLHP